MAANSALDVGAGTAPDCTSFACTSGALIAATTASCSFAITGAGVFAGASRPYQLSATVLANPCSTRVETSGRTALRASAAAPSGFNAPALRAERLLAQLMPAYPVQEHGLTFNRCQQSAAFMVFLFRCSGAIMHRRTFMRSMPSTSRRLTFARSKCSRVVCRNGHLHWYSNERRSTDRN